MTIFLFIIIGSYLVGNMLTGPIISRLFYRGEIRAEGSGNPGARNAGRLYGKKAFIVTFIGDALKGALAIFLVKQLGFGVNTELIVLFAVTLGHVYPIWYKFNGGKGVSTLIGGLIVFNPFVIGVFVGLFLLIYLFLKSFTLAGLGTIFFMPIIVIGFSYGISACIIACLVSILILYAHRDDLERKFLREKK